MKEDEAYLNVSKRFLESCEQHIANGVNLQEVIGFKSYHAFESIAGSFNSHFGHQIPSAHPAKINAFVANSKNSQFVNGRTIAAVAMLLSSVRNDYLYPVKNGADFKPPMDQLSMTNARDLVRRVKGIVRKVEKLI